MISTIASSYEAAADSRPAEPHSAWRRAWLQLRDDHKLGRRVDVSDLANYLADVPIEDQRSCVCDLIAEHLRLYSRAGEPQLEDYVAALGRDFPWLLDDASLPADLIEDEFIVRSTPPYGDYPRLAHYARRFPNRPDVHPRLARRCLADQRYIKLRVLGVGALGVVYEAYDSVADRLVAVKEVLPNEPEGAWRLEHEMQLAAALSHPGIVAAYEFGKSDGCAFYVMELVAGQSLSDRIGEYHARLPARSAADNRREQRFLVECVAQMCDAVAHAHERDILHRDLKPGNVMVRDTGEPAIVDWGLACRLPLAGTKPGSGGLEGNDMIAGTPQYMAPEQVDRQESPASDIFSLGATLYEVLTGHPPYHWRADFLPADWQTTVRGVRITPPRRLASGTPRELEAICMKALASAPQDRYARPQELAADLRQFLDTRSASSGWLTWIVGGRA